MPSTLIHRSVLQPISWESARTGGHFGCPFYYEKSLSTFIHMVLLWKVAQDLLDLNGKCARTKCQMFSSVEQHYKSRRRLRALAGVGTRDATVTSSIGFLCLFAQLVSVAFTQFSPLSVTHSGCHTVGGHPGFVRLLLSQHLCFENEASQRSTKDLPDTSPLAENFPGPSLSYHF